MIQFTEIVSNGKTLRGFLHKPEQVSGKIPMVIMFHGFCSDINEVNFVHTELSNILCSKGIASLRMAFAGSDASDGRFEDMTVSGEVSDAEAMIDYVKGLDWVDTTRIAIHGTSMGGMVASIVAGRNPDVIRALSMWCPGIDALRGCTRTYSLCGIDISNIERDGFADIEGLRIGIDFFNDLKNMRDPYEVSAQYAGPVNIVHGESDTTASVSTSYKLKEIYGDRCNFLSIPDAEHRFTSIKHRTLRMDSAVNFLCRELRAQ